MLFSRPFRAFLAYLGGIGGGVSAAVERAKAKRLAHHRRIGREKTAADSIWIKLRRVAYLRGINRKAAATRRKERRQR